MDIIKFLNDNSGLSVIIASLSTLVSVITVSVAIYYNNKNQKQYKESKKPQLSMRLDNYDGMLYLFIQNTGGTAAKEINVSVKSIERNGSNNELFLDSIFNESFELYPQETTQGRVSFWGATIGAPDVFPVISLNVKYKIPGNKKPITYQRTVTFSKYYDTKIFADVNVDSKQIEDSLDTTTRAAVRIANYLDGHQVAPFDKLNLLANKSLQNDLCSAVETAKRDLIKDRTTTIRFSFNKNIDDDIEQNQTTPTTSGQLDPKSDTEENIPNPIKMEDI